MLRSQTVACLISVFLVAPSCVPAQSQQDSDPPKVGSTFDFKTERVIVFKDGYCLVVKSGKAITDGEGKTFTKDVPDAAVLGSFWTLPKQGVLKNMVAGWEDSETQSERDFDCTQVLEIAEANLGKNCEIFFSNNQRLRGKIIKVLGAERSSALTAAQTRSQMGAMGRQQPSEQNVLTTFSSSSFVLRTSDGDTVLYPSSVQRIVIDEMNTTLSRKIVSRKREKKLTLQFEKPNSPVEVTYMYFRPGVRWIPTYRVSLTNKKIPGVGPDGANLLAEINLQGEILNEAEDLIDAPIDVVVGVPNFRFKTVPSPMILEATLQNLLQQAAPGLMGGSNAFRNQSMSNALYSQRSAEVRSARAMGGAETEVNLPEELSGKGTNDLFVYSLPSMTLKRGERATIPILSTQAPYRDVYTWDIELQHAVSYARSGADSPSPLVLEENRVWRQVELVNNTKLPWTTGAAMFVDGFQPLAQELLTYTSPGGICRVPVTVAVDLRGKAIDRETGRELKSVRWRGSDYALVKGKIETELANNKQTDVNVEVTLRFGGKAIEMSDDGKLRLEPFRQSDWVNRQGDAINNSSRVFWKSKITPGECFKPTVDYEFYIRH